MSSAAPKTVQRTPFKRWCDENTGLFLSDPLDHRFSRFQGLSVRQSLVYSFTDMNFFKGITSTAS